MESLNDCIKEYTVQLQKGQIQKAYKGIMSFMSELKNDMQSKYPAYVSSALYFGYMDMTYFAFTPFTLKKRKFKIAVVYLHEENKLEVWLGGSNRRIQAEYIALLQNKDIGDYALSQMKPGLDSIVAWTLVHQPDFDQADEVKEIVERNVIAFANRMVSILGE